MRRWLSIIEYRVRVWLARRWCDPQLYWLAERHGSVMVTAERHGKVLLPIYHAMASEATAEMTRRFYEMTQERYYWKKRCSDINSEAK